MRISDWSSDVCSSDLAPADVTVPDGMYYNTGFAGHQIAMPPPLFPDGVTYGDDTPATVEQQARDVAAFLAWASEPNLEQRKRAGGMRSEERSVGKERVRSVEFGGRRFMKKTKLKK